MRISLLDKMQIITSTRNEKLRLVKSLLTKKGRDEHGLFIAEGANLIKDIPKDYPLHSIFLAKSSLDKFNKLAKGRCKDIFVVEDTIFATISDTVTPSGILAVCVQQQPRELASNKVMVLDNIKDPANMGVIMRSCAAFGFYDIIGISCADIYNPKVVRSSMSAIFKLNYMPLDYTHTLASLKGYDKIILDVSGEDIGGYAFAEKTALILGNEARGVNEILRNCGKVLSIPMDGQMESLNASVAASIAMLQVYRKG